MRLFVLCYKSRVPPAARGSSIRPVSRPLTPAPPPSSAQTKAVMIGNKGRDTQPEVKVRAAIHAMGLRFRKNARPLKGLRCTADIVFPRERVAVFIDGCFWHGCPKHGRVPSKNSSYWSEKLERNALRDKRNEQVLGEADWTVLRYWEHEHSEVIAQEIHMKVIELRQELS